MSSGWAVMPDYALTQGEKSLLINHYLYQADYQRDCAWTQKRCAAKADQKTTSCFLEGDLLAGEKQTPENWMKRRDIFIAREKAFRDRAKYFSA